VAPAPRTKIRMAWRKLYHRPQAEAGSVVTRFQDGLRASGHVSRQLKGWPELFASFGGQSFHDGNILQQIRRQIVAFLQIGRAVIGDPNLSLSIFPDQNL
jgi:hypothetical protein